MSRLVTNPLTSPWKKSCHQVTVSWDSSFISKQHCPQMPGFQSVSLNLGPLRFHQLSSTTSLAPDLPSSQLLPIVKFQGWSSWNVTLKKKIQLFLIFLRFVMVKGMSFVGHNLTTLLLLFKLWIRKVKISDMCPPKSFLLLDSDHLDKGYPLCFRGHLISSQDEILLLGWLVLFYKHEKIFEIELRGVIRKTKWKFKMEFSVKRFSCDWM